MADPALLAQASEAATAVQNATHIPAELLLAQWAIESGWGQHMPGNNCFGIKAYPGCYGRQLLHTSEWFTNQELAYFLTSDPGRTATLDTSIDSADSNGRMKYKVEDYFATFPTLAACFERRAQLFHLGKYKPITDQYLVDGDLEGFVRAFSSIYATSPTYANTLLSIMGQRNVMLALDNARGGEGSLA